MSNLENYSLLENLYDEAWEDYRKQNNLTEEELLTIEQNSETGTIPEIEKETNKRFEELSQ